jgi:4-amino-4-deoxy-L-arabinose transferase-like glycosyltransferase
LKKLEISFGLQTFRGITPHILVLLVFIMAMLGAGLGVDFGQHWDEPVVLDQVYKAFDTGLLLSRYYIYPSLAFYLGLVAVTPELTQYLVSRPHAQDQRMAYLVRFKLAMLNYLRNDSFKLRARKIFIVVSLLAIFWIYLLVWFWRGNAWEALLAAALLGFSWEFSYHARWVVPDAPMLMFTVLTYLFLTLAWTRQDWPRWLKAAAVTAALTCGCKYQGGSLMLPILFSAVWLMRRAKPDAWKRELAWFLIVLFFLFGVVYVFTTPGTLLEPAKFSQNLGEQFGRYRTGHYGYTVHPGAEHYGLMTVYFATASLSSCPWTAAVLFGFAGLGFYDLCRRESRWIAVSFLSFPVFYFFYMGAFPVMIVRNILLLIPFLAVLSARGITWLWHQAGKHSVAKAVLLSIVLIAFIWNVYWVINNSCLY